MFFKQVKCISNKLSLQLFVHLKIQPSSTLYICTSCLHNINEDKLPLYQVSNIIPKREIVPLV